MQRKRTDERKEMKFYGLLSAIVVLMLASCSTTKNIPDDDQLFIGLTKIDYKNYEKSDHATTTIEEVEAALATAPNGALFGSSYYRTFFPYGLWVWNAYSDSETKFGKWMTKAFGKSPVLMSNVNPELRSSVAHSVLRNHGYFHNTVDYEIVNRKNPKKKKIGYTVCLNDLMTVDTLEYANFPDELYDIIVSSLDDAYVKHGTPFDAATLESERSRVSTLLRNNGYYFYESDYASYLADTVTVPGTASLRLQMVDDVPDVAKRKWYIGKIQIDLKKQFNEQLKDSFDHRFFKIRFNGKRPSMRPRVILAEMKLRPRQMFNYDEYTQSVENIGGLGMFSNVSFTFTPRDTTATCDTLDAQLTCTFSKPYDFYVETDFKNRVNGRMGPELVVGMTKRNAFRGGEKIDINLHGSYEWESGSNTQGVSSGVNSYEYGADVSLELPRILTPFKLRRRYYNTPSTTATASVNVMKRPDYFKMHTVAGEWTYRWQRTATSVHELSPLTLQYQHLKNVTAKFDSIMSENPYLYTTMRDVFIPKIRYTYKYHSIGTLNPLTWELTVSEAGNIISLGYMAAGDDWAEKDKELFKNAYAQFIKIETDITKTWTLSDNAQLVGHASGGVIWSYGNQDTAPYSEQFYVGGANSIRAFTVRTIGPGSYTTDIAKTSYLDQTGDIKLQFNLEYRFRMFGSLYGAAFLDAGNVWALRDDGYREGAKFQFKNVLKEMALGTGVGIRYDLDFLVLRLDWGLGIHVPYETGKSGIYNMPNFSDSHSLHLAVGYPF